MNQRATAMKHHNRRRSRGFTLIELLVAVAIVAIVSAIAYPSYASSVVRSKRSAASACLTEAAQFMERVYTTNLRYDQNNGSDTVLPTMQCRTDLSGRYTIVFGSATTQRAFTLNAEPQGTQASSDAACGKLTLNQAGVKGITGSSTVANCWR